MDALRGGAARIMDEPGTVYEQLRDFWKSIPDSSFGGGLFGLIKWDGAKSSRKNSVSPYATDVELLTRHSCLTRNATFQSFNGQAAIYVRYYSRLQNERESLGLLHCVKTMLS